VAGHWRRATPSPRREPERGCGGGAFAIRPFAPAAYRKGDLRSPQHDHMKKSHEPVVITQRGRATAVMVSVEEYERSAHEREILRLLVQGDKEVAAGKGYGLEQVIEEAERMLAK
jgi:PHD/YefM family antitoxin component YafN of YafNO toxin-antitoxin module